MNEWLNGRPQCDWEADIIRAARDRDRERDLRLLAGVLAGEAGGRPPEGTGSASLEMTGDWL